MNQALYGPIGGILVVVVGWALQQWTKHVEKKAQEKKDADAKIAQAKKDAEEREANRVDIADRVSEVWDRTSTRLDKDLAAMEKKCGDCELRLLEANKRIERRDRATYKLLDFLDKAFSERSTTERDQLHEATRDMREAMYEPIDD